MSPFISIRNSVETNPNNAAIAQTDGSVDWMWTAFAIFLLVDLSVIAFHFKRVHNYFLHQLAVIILTTAAVAYFCLASNLGSTPIAPEFHGVNGPSRAIWYVRYIMWFINAPSLLLLLYIGHGFPLSSALSAIFMTWVAVVCGLVGALVRTSYKWGFYVLGCFALFYVIGHMWTPRQFPTLTGRPAGSYRSSVGYLTLLSLLYPLAWGLCEGGNEIGVVGEMIWYGITDVLIFAVFVPYFLYTHRDVVLDGYRPGPLAAPAPAPMSKSAEAGRVA